MTVVVPEGRSDRRTDQPRSEGTGQFILTEASYRRDARAMELRSKGWTLQAISDELEFGGHGHVSAALARHAESILGESRQAFIASEVERLDRIARRAEEVLGRHHVMVSHGHVVKVLARPEMPCGEEECPGSVRDGCQKCTPAVYVPLTDDGPILAAIARLESISAQKRRLLGLDAPVKADITVTEVDAADAELAQMISEAKAKQAMQRTGETS